MPEILRSGDPASAAPTARPNRFERWRAGTLILVYVLMAAHILHWRVSGRTLAPLELHEVMYTFELGIVTAGFLFMAAAVVATAIFGRFFCSWGCHILALEDLSAWLLEKVGIRPRPIRSRMLLFVPPIAVFYMFVWPQVERLLVAWRPSLASTFGQPPPFDLRIAGDAEGWASFVTSDFWRNLPGPWTAAFTFLICGFAIIYFLGSRSFCNYACPYGVIFGLADRAAPGKILLTGDCVQCGICTAGCQSGIRVHEEIARFGKVVSSRCLKDLDCVGRCPEQALSWGFTRPSGFRSLFDRKRTRVRYDFSPGEEVLAVVAFLIALVVFRGLYSSVPFLTTLGLGVILAFLAVWTRRLFRRSFVQWHGVLLRGKHGLTRSGRWFITGAALVAVLVVHSGFIRYHETRADVALRRAEHSAPPVLRDLEQTAVHHLETVDRWGLVHPSDLAPKLATLYLALGETERAETSLRGIAESSSDARLRAGAHARLAGLRAVSGDRSGAIQEFTAAVAADPTRIDIRLDLADVLVGEGELVAAAEQLRAALALHSDSFRATYNLGIVLGQTGQFAEAKSLLERAARLRPDDARIGLALDVLERDAAKAR